MALSCPLTFSLSSSTEKPLCEMFLRLYLSVQSPSLWETQCDIDSCLVLREDLLMSAYKRVNNDSLELAEKWKLRAAQKRYLTSKVHLFVCQTFIQKWNSQCIQSAYFISVCVCVLESNPWPWQLTSCLSDELDIEIKLHSLRNE